MLNTLRFLLQHPLNRKSGRVRALYRYVRWQIGARLVPAEAVAAPFANDTLLLARPGMTGATGNIYAGLHEFEEMVFIAHLLRPGDLFVDVGANIGSYTVLACGAAGADGMAFEPDAEAFRWLRRNIGLNGLGARVQVHQKAVGAEEGYLRFSVGMDTVNHVLVHACEGEKAQEVEVVRLDSALNGRTPLAIKIDVEGYETQVLTGARDLLQNRELHCVIMELIGGGKRYGFDEDALWQHMIEAGFAPYLYHPFHRQLEKLTGQPQRNVIFIRDEDGLVKERLRTAPPLRTLGLEI